LWREKHWTPHRDHWRSSAMACWPKGRSPSAQGTWEEWPPCWPKTTLARRCRHSWTPQHIDTATPTPEETPDPDCSVHPPPPRRPDLAREPSPIAPISLFRLPPPKPTTSTQIHHGSPMEKHEGGISKPLTSTKRG
jgi:hypothetical protein